MAEIKLSEKITDKLSEAVSLWADEYLPGKPEILATGVYYQLERALIDKTKEINEKFGEKSKCSICGKDVEDPALNICNSCYSNCNEKEEK